MADVVVTLSLKRKSGILAAAISSLARAGLEFDSHRFGDGGDDAAHLLELNAAGELGDSGALIDELSRVRGVSDVADIRIDGRSILVDESPNATDAGMSGEQHKAPEAKPEPAPEPKPAPKPAPKPEPKPAHKPEPKSAPKPAPKPKPKPNPEPGAASAQAQSSKDEDDTVPPDSLRPSMKRRRRRRR